MEEIKKKVCSKCNEEKDFQNFKNKYRNKDGKSTVCNICKKIKVGIYKIISPSGKVYIGQSIDINSRWRDYNRLINCKKQTKLLRSFQKHGVEKHTFEVLEECLIDDLNCKERYWQDFYDVLNKKGLNLILQQCGVQKAVLSEDTRKRRGSKGDKNFFYGKSGELSPWFGVKGEANPNYGRVSINKGKELPHLKGENSPFYGKSRSEEVKNKISKNRIDNKVAVGDKNPRARKVIDTLTLEIFNTIDEACSKFNIHRTTFNRYMSGKLRNTTTLILLDNYVEGMEITPYIKLKYNLNND